MSTRNDSTTDRILRQLTYEPATAAEIRERIGFSAGRSTFHAALHALILRGEIERTGPGTYRRVKRLAPLPMAAEAK